MLLMKIILLILNLLHKLLMEINIEYIAYKQIKSINEIKFKQEGKSNIISIFFIIIILILIIIAAIIFLKFKKKKDKNENDEALKQVEMINPIEYEDVLLDRPNAIN